MSAVVSPTEYVIRVRFDVGAIPGLSGITSSLNGIHGQISGIGSGIMRGIMGPLALLAGYGGLRSLINNFVGLNSQIQTAEVGIAGLFNAIGKQDMTQAIGAAHGVLKSLRQDAAKGIGELDVYVRGFQSIYGPAAAAGASVAQVRELNRLSIAVGGNQQGSLGMRTAPLDVVQALRGGVRGNITPFASRAIEAIGMTEAQFRKLNGKDRIDALLRGFREFSQGVDLYSRTWEAQSAQFAESIKDITRNVTGGIFDFWTRGLRQVNGWLEKNSQLISDISLKAGGMLTDAQGKVMGNASGYAGAGAGVIGGAAGLRGAAALGAGALGGPGLLIAGALAGFLAFVTGAFTTALTRWPGMAEEIGGIFGDLGLALGGLADATAGLMGSDLVEFFGVGIGELVKDFGTTAVSFITWLTFFVDEFNYLGNALGKGLLGLAAYSGGHILAAGKLFYEANNALGDAKDTFRDFFTDAGGAAGGATTGSGLGQKLKKKIADGLEAAPPGGNVTNINGDVNVTIKPERMDDPFTVASSWREVMAQIGEFPTSSRSSRFAGKPR